MIKNSKDITIKLDIVTITVFIHINKHFVISVSVIEPFHCLSVQCDDLLVNHLFFISNWTITGFFISYLYTELNTCSKKSTSNSVLMNLNFYFDERC